MTFANCKYVIFDLDGTITDPKAGITGCAVYALSELGYGNPNPSDLEWIIGPPLLNSFMEYTGCDEAAGKLLVEKYRERYRPVGVHENELYPGIQELLVTLQGAGKTLAIASSKPEVFVRQILEDFRLTRYFTSIGGSDLDGKHVEKEAVLKSVLDMLNAKGCAVMVGDRKFDIEAAHKLGIPAIGVSYGYAQGGELTQAGADEVAASPAEICEIILRSCCFL